MNFLERSFSAEDRRKLAAKGQALKDGSYPIPDKDGLRRAIVLAQSGHGDVQAAIRLIKKRARQLGATDMLPEDWGGPKKTAEESARSLAEARRSWGQLTSLIQDAAQRAFIRPDYDCWGAYVCDVYDDYAIIRAGDLYSVPWAIQDGEVTFGDPTEVIVTYASAEDADGDGDQDADDGVLAPAGLPESLKPAFADLALFTETTELDEAGRQLSAENEAKLRGAVQAMTDHIDRMSGKVKDAGSIGEGGGDDDGQAATESADVTVTGDCVPLLEKAVRRDDTIAIKVIQPGWGSSGYYSQEVLRRDGPGAFPAGTKMYVDHPTAAEEAARPERSVKDLWAETISPARWEDNGVAGPGLYAESKVLGPKEAIEKLAPHIGVSIRASGKAKAGEAEGKKGPIIEAITAGHSIDFVTVPGAGGQVLQLFEAARSSQSSQITQQEATVEVDERAYQLLKEENAQMKSELARLKEGQTLAVAKGHVSEVLRKRYSDALPAVTIERLTESLAKNPPLTDGAIDYEAYGALIHEAAKSEMDYLSRITGSGRIKGQGSTGDAFAIRSDLAESQASLRDAFSALGLHDKAAPAAKGSK